MSFINDEEDEITAERPSQSKASDSINSILPDDESMITGLARRAVETYVSERRLIEPGTVPQQSLLNQRLACFVSIKTASRDLRGCIGTLAPESNTLASEIISNAVKAATCDPRFPPVSASELPLLRYSVDVLGQPEPARLADLDPAQFGVIVADERGIRRGVLLPNIQGIETPTRQVQIAASKAGIKPNEPIILNRFRTHRFVEKG